ncbi:iron-sulfur cluster carrier protein ApbC [Aliiglaciecola sp. CAU 1673]|uniref:iron-sulfur cluster carrier protein ApbC n=1 Tax=Aliiglaciecola sp. CAU 1673 TaxID=3032595 RepID=UPI0023DCC8F2|nr:iron-sulfur cluster carrier protein ApbC [Aliiglaciecola sp. CAU 1673]MDF2180272.1 iron-sulfur cluster carrier protein ApbC [Aliiglaciecola sp. CAU 1673]
MFFKKSKDVEQNTAMAETLAHFFSLALEQVTSWIEETPAGFDISLPFVCASMHSELELALKPHAKGKTLVISQAVPLGGKTQRGLRHIKQLVAIASGKGGVGKSSTCINLALALSREGARVGILDADIYGPSIPLMLGNPDAQPTSEDNKHMQPLVAHNLVANSIGYLVPADDAAIWRGPMASKALQQLLNETLWPELDYLLIDMPPGTGDIQLTLAQQVPVTGAVVVTTPQNIALADAQKAIAMFNKVSVPVLGVVENMSYHQCSNCGYREHLFAQGGGERISEKNAVPLLGQIPLDIHIRQFTDEGRALILEQPEHLLSQAYGDTARKLAREIYLAGLKQPQAIDISQV